MFFFLAQVRVLHLSALQQRRQNALLAKSIQTHDRIQVNPKFTCFTGTNVFWFTRTKVQMLTLRGDWQRTHARYTSARCSASSELIYSLY
jgi:hypothetical protein